MAWNNGDPYSAAYQRDMRRKRSKQRQCAIALVVALPVQYAWAAHSSRQDYTRCRVTHERKHCRTERGDKSYTLALWHLTREQAQALPWPW